MPVDEDLPDRIRELVGDQPGCTEGRMFGGVAFMIGGHLAVTASTHGGILVRVDPAETERLVDTTAATPMVMRGRELSGWVRVAADDVRTKRQLGPWVRRGVGYASSLPPKPPKRATRK